jgi:hypothetical protein
MASRFATDEEARIAGLAVLNKYGPTMIRLARAEREELIASLLLKLDEWAHECLSGADRRLAKGRSPSGASYRSAAKRLYRDAALLKETIAVIKSLVAR